MARPLDPVALKVGAAIRRGDAAGSAAALADHAEAGRLLAQKKASLKHGEWLGWLKSNTAALGFSDRSTASRFMKLAKEYDAPGRTISTDARKLWGHNKRAPTPAALADPRKQVSLIKSVEVCQASTKLRTIPLVTGYDMDLAVAFINQHHERRNAEPNNRLLFMGLIDEHGQLLGVSQLSRPGGGDGSDWATVAELSRVCVRRDTDVPHGCRILITVAGRMAAEWGYLKIKSFTELDESGDTYRNCGWRDDGLTKPGRDGGSKRRWIKVLEPQWRKAKRYKRQRNVVPPRSVSRSRSSSESGLAK